jgi:CRISPR/Cas system-associated endoribonuclease Cas2
MTTPRFNRISNSADGNCLFETLSYFVGTSHEQLRQDLYLFYQCFDKTKEYPDNSFEANIQLSLIGDNDDGMGGLHEDNVGQDKVWASFTDIMVLAHFLELNITVFRLNRRDIEFEFYSATENVSHYRNISILFVNGNHFEALAPTPTPKVAVKKPTLTISSVIINKPTREVITVYDTDDDVPLTHQDAVKELAKMILDYMYEMQMSVFDYKDGLIPKGKLAKLISSANHIANNSADPVAEIERLKQCSADEKTKNIKNLLVEKPVVKPIKSPKTNKKTKKNMMIETY